MKHTWVFAAALVAALLALPSGAAAATINVAAGVAEGSAGDGDAFCSLREAVTAANTNVNTNLDCTAGEQANLDTINVPAGTYNLATGVDDTNTGGDLDVTGATSGPLAIVGASQATTTINAGDHDRAIDLQNTGGATMRIEGLTLTNGTVTNQAGGGIRNFLSSLTIVNSAVTNNVVNSTSFGGGGISSNGALTLDGVTVSGNDDNESTGAGGAGISHFGGVMTISNSSITGNDATDSADGGGISYGSSSSSTITGTTITGNTTGSGDPGGGIEQDNGTLTVSNSTIGTQASPNVSGQIGGGIYVTGSSATLNLNNSKVSFNTAAGSGAGIGALSGPTVNVTSSVIAQNSSLPASGAGVIAGAGIDFGGSGVATATITGSAIRGNTMTDGSGTALFEGAGIFSQTDWTLKVIGSTISGNSINGGLTQNGAGIYNEGTLTLLNSTVNNNDGAQDGGGLFQASGSANVIASTVANNAVNGNGSALNRSSGTLSVRTSILHAGTASNACNGTITTAGNNIDVGDSCVGASPTMNDLKNADATLNLLGITDNGGPAVGPAGDTEVLKTREPGTGSPALNHVPPASCTDNLSAALLADERGVERPFGANCESGALEVATCLGQAIGAGWIIGTAGNDNTTGTSGNDLIATGAGADNVDPGGGADTVCTGGGNDGLQLADGTADNADCGAGTDTVQSDVQGVDQLTGCEATTFAQPASPGGGLPSNLFSYSATGRQIQLSISAPGIATFDPNPVTLAARTPLSVSAAKKRRGLPAKATSVSGSPPTITLPITLTKLGNQKLREKGKLVVGGTVTFTPTGGSPRSQAVSVKIKGKKR